MKFVKGRIPSEDGIPRQAWAVFHRSGEPMLPEWNSETRVKVKRDILLHFLRISFGTSIAEVKWKDIALTSP